MSAPGRSRHKAERPDSRFDPNRTLVGTDDSVTGLIQNPQRASGNALRPNTTKPLGRPLLFFLGNERKQLRVDLILMGCGKAVRSARVVDFLGALDELSRLLR